MGFGRQGVRCVTKTFMFETLGTSNLAPGNLVFRGMLASKKRYGTERGEVRRGV